MTLVTSMRSIYRTLVVSVVLWSSFLVAGCRQRATAGPRPNDRNVLTQVQLGDHRFNNAYDAVEALRSNWLNTRGSDSFQAPSHVRVYLDNVSLGDKETLRTIAIATIVYIRYFDGISATARWGLDHGGGVIYVSTRPAGAIDPKP
jgi:hypothetical protein